MCLCGILDIIFTYPLSYVSSFVILKFSVKVFFEIVSVSTSLCKYFNYFNLINTFQNFKAYLSSEISGFFVLSDKIFPDVNLVNWPFVFKRSLYFPASTIKPLSNIIISSTCGKNPNELVTSSLVFIFTQILNMVL